MTIRSKNNRSFARRHVNSLFIALILTLSGLIPFLYHFEAVTVPPATASPPLATITTSPININTVAGEPNYTRESWPFIIDNYPLFTWKNPGKFNGSQNAAGAILNSPAATYRGFDKRLPTVGAGPEAYQSLYNSISGLNESNIRIMYLDAEYNWISAPYQIDQRGWANIWYPADLNKFAGVGVHGAGGCTGSFWATGAGEHIAADPTVGLGWISGDMVNSEGLSNYGTWNNAWGANNIQNEWYRIPIWTYVSPRQPNGTVTNEELVIDPEYRNNLIFCYMDNRTVKPHTAWLTGDTRNTFTNAWNVQTGAAAGGRTTRNEFPIYAVVATGWRPCFVNTTAWANPWVDTAGHTNMIFMGDTWYTTPGSYTYTAGGQLMPQWVKTAFPYQQINGAIDKDDQICFYAYNGRQAPGWLWWNYSYFPQRFELAIVDPVDGGRTWMYIYFNNNSAWNPVVSYLNPTAGKNLGPPKFTTTDADGNPIDCYTSWDPASNAVTTDFYRTTFDNTYPGLVSSLRLFGNTDGQSILTQFNKMFIYGHVTMVQSGITAVDVSLGFGRRGVWYKWPAGSTTTTSYNEIVCNIDNPSVLYPGIPKDSSITRAYSLSSTGQPTADRRNVWLAPQCPQNYWGPLGITRNASRPAFNPTWGFNSGDQRAVINGPCRVIFYWQSYLLIGAHLGASVSGTVVLNDDLDIVFPIMDGPQVYYRRMQISPETSIAIPSIAGATIQIYYAYIECGTINPAIRNDLNVTAGKEWIGGADGTDNRLPKFGWNNNYGYTKIGGLDPKTSGYSVLGFSDFNAAHNQSNYYKSQGDPLLMTTPTLNANVVPPTGNNSNLCDWAIVTSPTHGGVWLYIPRREANETRDNNGRLGATALLKMYYRDDGGPYAHPEFGICLDGGVTPWIQGGAATSPYKLVMVFGEFPQTRPDIVGHKLYCDTYFPLEGTASPKLTPDPGPRFLFQSAQPDQLVYKNGQKINLLVTGGTAPSWGKNTHNATIYVNTKNINGADPERTMTNRGDGSWNFTYTIGSVGLPYSRYINLTADVPGVLWTTNSTYTLAITIDNVASSPTGQLAALAGSTAEASVLLDWTAVKGFDVGSSSMANPSGLGWYKLSKGTISGTYDTILADNIPLTTTQFVDSFIENGKTYYYKLYTYDVVGNVNNSATERSTTIVLPFIPAQPADLPPTKNPGAGILIDWTANPGYGSGVTITGYRVSRATAIGGPYAFITPTLPTTTKAYTDTGPAGGFVEATRYYYKVLSASAGQNLTSASINTRIDRVAPAPAELATPLPTYKAARAEIIVSWAIDVLPEYQTGGFPGQDLNGIDHWIVYKQARTKVWAPIATVPYSAIPDEQRVLDISVVNGARYNYSIWTYDAAGNRAQCAFNKTTVLQVVGPGVAEIYSVVPGSDVVKQGATLVPVTVLIRNPGTASITLNQVKLYLHKFNVTQEINVTNNYQGVILAGGGALAQYTNRSFTFSVNVSVIAQLGTITVDAQATYDTTKQGIGPLFSGSWVVTPDAALSIQSITSSKSVVYPGQKDIPVVVRVENPGKSNATIATVHLTFTQGGLDVSNDYLVECTTPLPTSGFNRAYKFINFNVTVGQSATSGGVTIDASVTGSASGVPLEGSGAITPLTWAVQSSAKPVIASVVADKAVYWNGDILRLTVTCDRKGITYKGVCGITGYFNALDGTTTNETATDNGDRTYTITHSLSGMTVEKIANAIVYAQNASGVSTQIVPIRLGLAPAFSAWTQTPPDGSVESYSNVNVTLSITDANGVSAYLKYRFEGGDWNTRTMINTGSNRWTVLIPAMNAGGDVEYVINATDGLGNWALYSKSYTVRITIWVANSEKTYNPSIPTQRYNETPGYGAPRDIPIAYSATVTTAFIDPGTGGTYVVVVSAFDPVRHDWVTINNSVYLANPSAPIKITLLMTFSSNPLNPNYVASGTLITGRIYICSGLPKNGGRTLSSIPFTHLIA